MYRFLLKPKWIAFTLLVVLAIVGMLAASSWQWHRHQQRDAFTSRIEQRLGAQPQPIGSWIDKPVGDAEFRNVTARGVYVGTSATAVTDGGYWVMSPIKLDDGRTVLVNRGRIPTTVEVPATPAGEVSLVGRLRRPAQTMRDLDLAGAKDPMILELIESKPPEQPVITPEPKPDLTGGPPHLSYAVQWLIFSICAAVGWVLAVRRSARPPSLATAGRKSSKHQAVPWRDE